MIKIIRTHKGIRQRDLAHRLGVTQSYLSKLENNPMYEINVNIDIIKNLALELNVCPIAIFLYFLNVNIFCPFSVKKIE